MSTVERVQAARSPQEAMLALAEALDSITALVVGTPKAADAWGGNWANGMHVDYTRAAAASRLEASAIDNTATIAQLEQQIAEATDGEDRRALEAQLRLARDNGIAVPPAVPEGVRIDTDGELVNFPKPNGPRMQARADLAHEWPMHTFLAQGNELDSVAFSRAYQCGGPMWLYIYDRDAVMAMPDDWRRAFIEDIHLDSPAQAQEVARDILKDTDPGKLPTLGSED
jgi:hypothetical protein